MTKNRWERTIAGWSCSGPSRSESAVAIREARQRASPVPPRRGLLRGHGPTWRLSTLVRALTSCPTTRRSRACRRLTWRSPRYGAARPRSAVEVGRSPTWLAWREQMTQKPPSERVRVFITMDEAPYEWQRIRSAANDIEQDARIEERRGQVSAVTSPVVTRLEALGATEVVEPWITTSVEATVNAGDVAAIATWPGVREVMNATAVEHHQTEYTDAYSGLEARTGMRTTAFINAGITGDPGGESGGAVRVGSARELLRFHGRQRHPRLAAPRLHLLQRERRLQLPRVHRYVRQRRLLAALVPLRQLQRHPHARQPRHAGDGGQHRERVGRKRHLSDGAHSPQRARARHQSLSVQHDRRTLLDRFRGLAEGHHRQGRRARLLLDHGRRLRALRPQMQLLLVQQRAREPANLGHSLGHGDGEPEPGPGRKQHVQRRLPVRTARRAHRGRARYGGAIHRLRYGDRPRRQHARGRRLERLWRRGRVPGDVRGRPGRPRVLDVSVLHAAPGRIRAQPTGDWQLRLRHVVRGAGRGGSRCAAQATVRDHGLELDRRRRAPREHAAHGRRLCVLQWHLRLAGRLLFAQRCGPGPHALPQRREPQGPVGLGLAHRGPVEWTASLVHGRIRRGREPQHHPVEGGHDLVRDELRPGGRHLPDRDRQLQRQRLGRARRLVGLPEARRAFPVADSNKCLVYNVVAYSVPPGQTRRVYVADYYQSGNIHND